MNVGGRGNTSRIGHQFADAFDIKCVFGCQQMTQRSSHGVLTFVSGHVQNLHVHFVGDFL